MISNDLRSYAILYNTVVHKDLDSWLLITVNSSFHFWNTSPLLSKTADCPNQSIYTCGLQSTNLWCKLCQLLQSINQYVDNSLVGHSDDIPSHRDPTDTKIYYQHLSISVSVNICQLTISLNHIKSTTFDLKMVQTSCGKCMKGFMNHS